MLTKIEWDELATRINDRRDKCIAEKQFKAASELVEIRNMIDAIFVEDEDR